MSDKERLENLNPIIVDNQGNVTLKGEDYHWLMEQAERVQELEEIIEDYKTVNKESYDRRKKLRKQNKRYREALEFYADENNYFVDISKLELPEDIFYAEPPVVNERGIKARQALEESK